MRSLTPFIGTPGRRIDTCGSTGWAITDLVIFGGEDHKTGQSSDTNACYERLEQALKRSVPEAALSYRWSGQVIEAPDGLPYIGRMTDHQYSATGFGGNGLTFGTLAATVMTDGILNRPNPWAELFDPARSVLGRGLWDYLKENADYPYGQIRDRFAGAESRSLRSVKRGQGRSSTTGGIASPRPGIQMAPSRCFPPNAHIEAASWNGTRPNGPGTARVTGHDSKPAGPSSLVRRRSVCQPQRKKSSQESGQSLRTRHERPGTG